MKKNFFKKLALVLALVMVATSINYVPASAASAPAWKAKKTVISLGNTYTYGVKNVNKKYKVTYTSSKKTVGTINKTSGKFTAKKAGKTNVHAIVKNGSKTVKDLVQKVEVKAPAWKNTKSTMEAGERSTFTVTYKATGSTQKWSSSDTKIAKVSSKGSVLAVGVGTATITTKVYDKNGTRLKTLKTDVTVAGIALTNVKQAKSTELTATFSGAPENVKASDFVITNTSTNAVMAVKSVKADDADKKIIKITTYAPMKDGKVYSVVYDGKTVEFTATDGTVADVNVSPVTITKSSLTEIKAQTVDAGGVVIDEYTLSEASKSGNVTFTINTNNGYTEGDKLYLTEEGNTATAKVEYHTYKYDETGKETGAVTKEITITAVKDAAVVSNFRFTIGENAPNWNTLTDVNTKVATNENNVKAYFKFKDSNDSDVTEKYSVESGDPTKVLLNGKGDDLKNGVAITGVAEGSAWILVKNADDQIVTSLQVTVVAKRKASTLSLDNRAVVIAKGVGMPSQSVGLTVKDQYGDKMTVANSSDIKVTKISGQLAFSEATNVDKATDKVTFKDFGTDGSASIKVDATVNDVTVSNTLTINVKDTSGKTGSRKLVLDGVDANNTVDLKVADDAKSAASASKVVKVKVASIVDNAITGYLKASDVATVTIKDPNGKTMTTAATGSALTVNTATEGSSSAEDIVVFNASSANGNAVEKNLETGSYSVKIDTVDGRTYTTGFSVKDTQAAATIDIKKNSTDDFNTIRQIFYKASNMVEIRYAGDVQDLGSSEVGILKDEYFTKSSGNTVYVYKVKVRVSVNSAVDTYVVVPVNAYFTLNGTPNNN